MLLIFSHGATLAPGFVLGIYFLPILTAPPAPEAAMREQAASGALHGGTLTRDLRRSVPLYCGEGPGSLMPDRIVH